MHNIQNKNSLPKNRRIKHQLQSFIRIRQTLRFRFTLIKVSAAILLSNFPINTANILFPSISKAILTGLHSTSAPVNEESKRTQTESFMKIKKYEPDTPQDPKQLYRIGYVDLTNTGLMYVSANTTLASEGSVITSSSGTTENNGNMYLKGDWINNGTFTRHTGKVTFWDLDDQLIDGTNSTVFYNLDLNKSPGRVTLNKNTEVTNNLNLINGVLDLNEKVLTISNSAISAISYSNGFIKSENVLNASKVQWNIGSTTGSHTIPFGTNSDVIIPLSLNLTSGDIGNVTASTYPTASDNTPYPRTPDSVITMRDNFFNDNSANVVDRFWQINKSGASGTLTITFTYAPGEEPATGEANLVAQLYNAPYKGWLAPFASQTANTSDNSVTAPGISNFGPFTLSKFTSPLPIQLLSFTVMLTEDKDALLDWVTSSEINNRLFTIQRSKNLIDIEEILHLPGAGNSTVKQYYQTVDFEPLVGDSYYRLKQTDFDGNFTFSDWRHIELEPKTETEFSIENIYPNPFSDEFKVDFTVSEDGNVMAKMYSDKGAEIYNVSKPVIRGNNSVYFNNHGNLASGTYYFVINFKGKTKTIKLLKQN